MSLPISLPPPSSGSWMISALPSPARPPVLLQEAGLAESLSAAGPGHQPALTARRAQMQLSRVAREEAQTPPWLAEVWLFMHSSWAVLHQISLLGLCSHCLPALCSALLQASTLHLA